MDFDRHHAKEAEVRAERGLGVGVPVRSFTGRAVEWEDDRHDCGERRMIAVGRAEGRNLDRRLHRSPGRDGAMPLDHHGLARGEMGAGAMARRGLSDIVASAPDLDVEKLDATAEDDIRRYKAGEGYGSDYRPSGSVLAIPTAGELRARLDLTQEAFAAFLRVPVGTVRNWEQGRTPPDPAARTLLALVAADPAHAARILGKPSTEPPEGRSRVRRLA